MTWRQGVYQVLDDLETVGIETWRIYTEPNRITIRLETDQTDQFPRLEHATIQLTPDWRPVAFAILVNTEDGLRAYDAQRSGNTWISQRITEDGKCCLSTLPMTDLTLINYLTPLTHSIAIRRLNLHPGQSKDVSILDVRYPEFDPVIATRTYRRLHTDELVRTDPSLTGDCYRYSDSHTGSDYTFWTDEDGIVVSYNDVFRLIFV